MSYTLTLHHRLVRMAACWLLFHLGSYSIICLQNLPHYTSISRPPTRCRIAGPSFSPCCFSRPQVFVSDFQMNGVLHPQDQYLTLGHFSLHSNAFEHSEKSTWVVLCWGRQSKVWEVLLPPRIIFSEGFKMTSTWPKHCGLALKPNFHWWDSYVF